MLHARCFLEGRGGKSPARRFQLEKDTFFSTAFWLSARQDLATEKKELSDVSRVSGKHGFRETSRVMRTPGQPRDDDFTAKDDESTFDLGEQRQY